MKIMKILEFLFENHVNQQKYRSPLENQEQK